MNMTDEVFGEASRGQDARPQGQAGVAATALAAEHHKRLLSLVEGWECGARLSDEIVKAFQPELDAFTSEAARDGSYDLRLLRAVLDERSNRDAMLKDAAALRALLALTPQDMAREGGSSAAEPQQNTPEAKS
jgi:hypothetical protein